MKIKANRTGFTLAEVLITLGIIGIIASITIPVVVQYYQKKVTITAIQEVYSVLNSAMKRSEVENGSSTTWPKVFNIDYYDTYWRPYFVGVEACYDYKSCGYKKNDPWLTLGNKTTNTDLTLNSAYNLKFLNGTFFRMTSGGVVVVDINGGNNPNKTGQDVFYFDIVHEKGQVLPHGYEGLDISDWCSATKNLDSASSGAMCAEKIRRAGWDIDDNYPWN